MTDSQIDHIFSYHSPTEEQKIIYSGLRGAAKHFGKIINAACPESREKSIAITFLQQCLQMANAAIAIHNGHSTGDNHIKPL